MSTTTWEMICRGVDALCLEPLLADLPSDASTSLASGWVPARPASLGRKGVVSRPVRITWDDPTAWPPRATWADERAATHEPRVAFTGDTAALAEQISNARWRMLTWCESQFTRRAMAQGAHLVELARQAQREGFGCGEVGSLDEEAIRVITTRAWFGDESAPGLLARLSVEMTDPHTFDRVDPARWLNMRLKREADDLIWRTVRLSHRARPWLREAARVGIAQALTQAQDAGLDPERARALIIPNVAALTSATPWHEGLR